MASTSVPSAPYVVPPLSSLAAIFLFLSRISVPYAPSVLSSFLSVTAIILLLPASNLELVECGVTEDILERQESILFSLTLLCFTSVEFWP